MSMDRHTRVLDTGKIWPIHGVDAALKRLAAYEDTGLEPGEIQTMGEDKLYLVEYISDTNTAIKRHIVRAVDRSEAKQKCRAECGRGIDIPHEPRVISISEAQAALAMYCGFTAESAVVEAI